MEITHAQIEHCLPLQPAI